MKPIEDGSIILCNKGNQCIVISNNSCNFEPDLFASEFYKVDFNSKKLIPVKLHKKNEVYFYEEIPEKKLVLQKLKNGISFKLSLSTARR